MRKYKQFPSVGRISQKRQQVRPFFWEGIQSQCLGPHCDLRMQFTSGATSGPKAVLFTHANALFAVQQTARSTICK